VVFSKGDGWTEADRMVSALAQVNDGELFRASSVVSRERHSHVSAKQLAKKWRISVKAAEDTLKTTTQFGVRHSVRPITRRYHTDTVMLHRRRLDITAYSDTLVARVQSLRGNKYAQVFYLQGYVRVYPIPSKANAGDALQLFVQDVGIP
jgi:hypothetical protein